MGFWEDRKTLRESRRALEIAQAENQIAKMKANTAAMDVQREAVERFANSGYSHGGASTSATWAKRYHQTAGHPKVTLKRTGSC